ncbi:Nramp family divalent metal transporter [Candidatus Aminicenantes bacterium AC-708-M15]|nr:Nramp family divalent metal transporter [SCandidatus Aminicenantes bacterium Aminicenantia_JdfR_composite]MCP2597397.1 Nramp family divalent metal transporter [Candidatus Aminicenantes bacterium AC-335-G13]MCP2598156.1 Nramp family divalent metal transporter [Candidatus Aminicenantes bacterium AC-335-L06]MCP2598910.1 Nramp family divalent metal transporter [Candidatus Aminicenantes bacterium AC-335-B20]MCP2603854.1 Nramp family divalent metal transporter [Candidatus Aminicenantes bacterium A
MAQKNKKFSFGPGFLITAAFIGPGTVTTCSLAGAKFGYALIYAMVFATLTTIILQEMSGRLGLASGFDLAQALREFPENKILKIIYILLTFSAITFGCAVYEAGNIIGGSLGLEMVTPISKNYWVILISFLAGVLLSTGKYNWIEKFLITLVAIMGFSFLTTAIIVRPDFKDILKSFVPTFPLNSFYYILALIGTTVVPYNLFLHSAVVKEKWKSIKDLTNLRKDLFLSISLGGIISISIIITSAVAFYAKGIPLEKGAQLAEQLEPLFGPIAKILFGIGFFAAGMSSALTAPYAAAFASAGVFNWKRGKKDFRFNLVWAGVILIGLFISLLNLNPLAVIVFAQAANGLILPVASIFLLLILNDINKLRNYANNLFQNILGIITVAIVSAIGIWHIIRIFLH